MVAGGELAWPDGEGRRDSPPFLTQSNLGGEAAINLVGLVAGSGLSSWPDQTHAAYVYGFKRFVQFDKQPNEDAGIGSILFYYSSI